MRYLPVGVLLAADLAASSIVVSQQTAPTENKGVAIRPVAAMNLAPEIEGLAGRQLRMRFIGMEPGGHFAIHNHKDRPTLEYILAGTVIEYRDGGRGSTRPAMSCSLTGTPHTGGRTRAC